MARPSTGALRSEMAEQEQQIDEIKALTMHRMIDESGDGASQKKLVFFTNHQAGLFTLDLIPTLTSAFQFPRPKLVINLLPCAGGTATINYGMLAGFKKLKPDSPSFTNDWKELLAVQAKNDPNMGICQDVLPIAPFFTEQELHSAEWKVECFMRDVLVPLAAETNALIIGSAFKHASLMMMFSRVAATLDSKYGGVGKTPWTMLGLADAPSLCASLSMPDSAAYTWYTMSKKWQDRLVKIKRAKKLTEMMEHGEHIDDMNEDGEIDGLDVAHLLKGEQLNPSQIPYDLNPNLLNIIVVDCVQETSEGRAKRVDSSAKTKLEAVIMDYLVKTLPVIGIGTMHNVGGYAGLQRAANYLNMRVPLLMLDLRERPVLQKMDPLKLFETAKKNDNELMDKLAEAGRTDIYELCRLSYLHSLLLQNHDSNAGIKVPDTAPLHQAISLVRTQMKSADNDDVRTQRRRLIDEVGEHCLHKEFQSYWALLPQAEIDRLAAEEGIKDYEGKYANMMSDARSAYCNVLSSDLLYTAPANDIPKLAYMINNQMMKKERLPQQDSLDGLLVVRAVCVCVCV